MWGLYDLLCELTSMQAWDKVYSNKSKYPDLDKETFDKLNALYPKSDITFNKGVFNWLYRLHSSGKLKPEDYYKVEEYLAMFEKFKHKIDKDKRDINRIKTIPELFDIVEPFIGAETETGKLKNIRDKEIESVYEDGEWNVYIPKTERASCLIGKGTQWCTAAETSNNYFDHYNKQGPLYVLINKDSGDKFQFHIPSGQYMDERDSPVSPFMFFDDYSGYYNFDTSGVYDFFKKVEGDVFENSLLDWAVDNNEMYYSELFMNLINKSSINTYPQYKTLLDKLRWSEDDSMVLEGFMNETDPSAIEDSQIEHAINLLQDNYPEGVVDLIAHLADIGYESWDGKIDFGKVGAVMKQVQSLGLQRHKKYKIGNNHTLTYNHVDISRIMDDNPNSINVTLDNKTGMVTPETLINFVHQGYLF